MIKNIDAVKLGEICGRLIGAGITPRGLHNVLWLLKHRIILVLILRRNGNHWGGILNSLSFPSGQDLTRVLTRCVILITVKEVNK